MSEAYKNFAAVLDLLEENDVLVAEVNHKKDYGDGSSLADFELTVSVPIYDPNSLRDDPNRSD